MSTRKLTIEEWVTLLNGLRTACNLLMESYHGMAHSHALAAYSESTQACRREGLELTYFQGTHFVYVRGQGV